MAYIKCDGCGEIIEIPAELCPDPESIAITEPYYCDACEIERGLTKREPDDGDSPVETELSNDELDTDYQLWSNM
jgi:hypothetical protein